MNITGLANLLALFSQDMNMLRVFSKEVTGDNHQICVLETQLVVFRVIPVPVFRERYAVLGWNLGQTNARP